jgi:hypothetical protein
MDALLAANNIISSCMAGKICYMDSREDEQERGMMESSGAGLVEVGKVCRRHVNAARAGKTPASDRLTLALRERSKDPCYKHERIHQGTPRFKRKTMRTFPLLRRGEMLCLRLLWAAGIPHLQVRADIRGQAWDQGS